MPDIQQQLESLTRVLPSVTEEFQDVARSLDNITGNAESTANAFENLVIKTTDQIDSAKDLEKELPKLAKEMSQLTKGSRLTTKGFKALEDSLGQTGKDLSKSMQAVYGQTDKAIGKVNNAFEKFSARIPVIGKTIQKGFENFVGSFEGVIDRYMARIQRAGAGGRGAMAGAGILGAAGVALATLLGKQFNQIEKSSIAISKATGLTGKDLEGVRTSMLEAQDASYQLGISMEESAAASSALVTSLGNFRKITPELIKQTTVLAKFTGRSAEEAGNFIGTLTKGFGKSAEDVDDFVNGIASFATREGVNARKVLGDIVSDTSLMSIYMGRGEDALKRAAVQAAKMNMSLSETQGVASAFLDLDQGAETVGLINMYTGSSLNALEMFNLAARDGVAVTQKIGQAFANPRGIRFIEDMPNLAAQFASQFGMNLKQLRVAAGIDRERSKILTGEEKKQQRIEEIVAKQQTSFQKIANEIQKNIFPVVNKIAEKLVNFTEGITASQVKSALQIGGVLAGGALIALLSKGTRLNPMFVEMSTGGRVPIKGTAKAAKDAAMGGLTKARAAMDAGKNVAAQGGSRAARAGARTAGLARAGMAVGSGVGKAMLKSLPFIGAAISAVEALRMFQDGNYLGAGLTAIGGLASFIPGLGTGAAIALGGAGQLTELFGMGTAATGQVVSSPRLFMVGEENRKEVIVPTERIRKGLPINAGVARELGSIGVPGYQAGILNMAAARNRQGQAQQIARSQTTVQQGAQSDPAVIRERELAFQRQAQQERDAQRRMMQEMERKTFEILEEEKRTASNISTSHGDFRRGVGLFQRIQQAAGQYARKTFNRFADNLRKSNGDLGEALKMTWAQTVGDIEQLQTKLLNKMNSMIAGLVNKLGSYLGNLASDAGNAVLDFGKRIFGIDNKANAEQFDQGMKDLFKDTVTDPLKENIDAAMASSDELQTEVLPKLSMSDMNMSGDGMTLTAPPEMEPTFYQKITDPIKDVVGGAGRAIGDAIRNSTEGFNRGRAFGLSGAEGNLDTSGGFFEGSGARVGKLFGDLERTLGPVTKGIGSFASSLDGASVSMLASGDIAGASVYLAQKAAVDTAIKTSLSQAMPNLGEGNTASLLAGTSALIQGDTKGAAKAVGMDLAKRGVTSGVNTLLGAGAAKSGLLKGLSVGGGVAAAGLGAAEGLMSGDYKMAAKGAAQGAVGYVLGGALAAAGLGPLGPVVGSIVAGPVTDGIITTGKELGKGAKNLGKGVGKIFEGDFKGGLGSLAKGGGQILMSGIKGIGALAKGIGGIFGIGTESKKDKRRKFLKMLMNDLANQKPLVGPGGRLRNKKAQERLIVGLKWGENGPDQALMNEMTAQIMTIAGVPMDIAQAFIFAAAGADFSDEDLKQLDVEMGTGFANADLSNQFDMSTKKGRRQAYRFLREDGGANISDNLRTVSDASEASAASERERQSAIVRQEIARLAADGLTLEEVRQISRMQGGSGLTSDYNTGGSNRGIDATTGNVYLDGVIVGTLTQESADELKADGLPAGMSRNNMSFREEDKLYGTSHL